MLTRYPSSILEEELKGKVAADWFGAFDGSHILGKVDFCAAALRMAHKALASQFPRRCTHAVP